MGISRLFEVPQANRWLVRDSATSSLLHYLQQVNKRVVLYIMDELFRKLDDAVTEYRQLARLRTRGETDKKILDICVSQLHTLIDDINYSTNEAYLDSITTE